MGTTHVYLSPDFSAFWEDRFEPWLRRNASDWQAARPPVVLMPSRSFGYFIRARLLEAGVNSFGLRFWTVTDVRAYLTQKLKPSKLAATRENFHLLLAAAAEQEWKATGQVTGSAMAVRADPAAMAQGIDRLQAAGWDYAREGPKSVRPVARRFDELLAGCGLQTLQGLDRWLAREAAGGEPLLGRLLMVGFDATHWPQWHLLQAAVHSAEEATLCLQEPHQAAADLDRLWIGSWEESFGAAIPVPAPDQERPAPYRAGLDALEGPAPSFWIGRNLREEARAIFAQVLLDLIDPRCARLAILFPGPGALPREVARLLDEQQIPHYDGLAHPEPVGEADLSWQAWLELQARPHGRALLRFLKLWPKDELWPRLRRGGVTAKMKWDELREIIDRSMSEHLIDDFAFVRAHLKEAARAEAWQTGVFLDYLQLLPEEASFSSFLAATEEAMAILGWQERWREIQQQSIFLANRFQPVISRALFLRWLGEITEPRDRVRSREGRHFYARVQLLTCAEAEHQTWTHLILAGQTEGEWPPGRDDSGYLTSDEIARLNREMESWNQRAVRPGSQGEGHTTVLGGRTPCLGDRERYALALRQLQHLIENTEVHLTLTCHLGTEAEPERGFMANGIMSRLYGLARGTPLTDEAADQAADATAQWAAEVFRHLPNPKSDIKETDLAPVRRAYAERRAPTGDFGPYEFNRGDAATRPVRLTCREWEHVLRSPALAWMGLFLGVRGGEEGVAEAWKKATGVWVHRWLAAVGSQGQFGSTPAPESWRDTVGKAAHASREEVARVAAKLSFVLPGWWRPLWAHARVVADQLCGSAELIQSWPALATEFKIEPTVWRDPVGRALHLRGKIDLLLGAAGSSISAPIPDEGWKISAGPWWIIDYKTGRSKSSLRRDDLVGGKGVQVALYALALSAMGARELEASLLGPADALGGDPKKIGLVEILEMTEAWSALIDMQESGCFGMHGALRDPFVQGGVYPMATLSVDPDLLAAKWEARFPAWRELV